MSEVLSKAEHQLEKAEDGNMSGGYPAAEAYALVSIARSLERIAAVLSPDGGVADE